MSHRKLIGWGALQGAVAIAMGAFGAHALRPRVAPRDLEIFEVGARYHMYAALATILIGLAVERGVRARGAGWLMQVGIVLFSGSLYALAITGVRSLGAITPVGGVAFLTAWLWLAKSAWSSPRESAP
ncbi:MAG: DUF423 domain-containing protein [Kofleriaceae bacterium]